MEQIFATFIFFLMAAVLVEKLTEIIGDRLPKIEKKTLSIVIGVVVSMYANFNVLELIGIPFGWDMGNLLVFYLSTFTGILFSGLILSTGANGVHDLLSKLQKSKEISQAALEALEVKKEPPELSIESGRLKE